MADSDNTVDPINVDDVDMGGAEDHEATQDATQEGDDAMGSIEADVPVLVSFLDYLKSPIVELVVGSGDEQTVLSAHEALLIKSPYFAERCEQFKPKGARRISLPDEDLAAAGSVLEYLYNGEYFPKRISQHKDSPLETDPSVPEPDNDGIALLRHARIYTLADKLGMPALKSLAHSKIHRTNSTAKGEIVYARYVYQNTSRDDVIIRKPVAAFWATRSHVLRHEAQSEFRSMCLEFPQFGFDVLSLVLDQKEKRSGGGASSVAAVEIAQAVPSSGRKRVRVSHG